MEIAIAGEGELVIRYIDKDGRTLMQERLVVSGSPTMQALHRAPQALQTADGATDVTAVLVRRSNVSGRPIVSHRGRGSRATRGRPC
jgi:hypothetical protein